MASSDTVLHAFEDWWGTTGSELLLERQEHDKDAGIEIDAFKAGVEWERERCANLVDDEQVLDALTDSNYHDEVAARIKLAKMIRAGVR